MSLFLDQDGFESSFQNVAGSIVPAIEFLRVPAVESVHAFRESAFRSFNEQVVMIPEEAVAVKEPAVLAHDGTENSEEETAVPIVSKYQRALAAAADYVIQRSGKLEPQWSNHL